MKCEKYLHIVHFPLSLSSKPLFQAEFFKKGLITWMGDHPVNYPVLYTMSSHAVWLGLGLGLGLCNACTASQYTHCIIVRNEIISNKITVKILINPVIPSLLIKY